MTDSERTMSPSPLLRIPQELLLQILALLPLDDQIAALQVCSIFHELILYTPSLQSTRYALDSGIRRVRGSLNPEFESCYPHITKPQTHTIMEPLNRHPFGRLLCASTGGTITRYAYRRCCDGEPQTGAISLDSVYEEQPTQEGSEEEKDTAIIALTMAIYKFKVTDVTNCPFLDEPLLQPSTGAAAAVEREEDTDMVDNETDYVTFECDVVVHRNIFQPETRDPQDWVEKFKLTKHTTVRQITAALVKSAFRKLELTGLQSHHTAENVIRLWVHWNTNIWHFTLIHYRTSPETQNMVWKLKGNTLGDYIVSRRLIS